LDKSDPAYSFDGDGGSCHLDFYWQDYVSGPVTVQPALTSISPAQGLIVNTVAVTLNGQGFGTSPSVDAGSNITVTINSHTDTQIEASFAISNYHPGGNQSVTVTSSGQTSSSVNFYVQIPTSLHRTTYESLQTPVNQSVLDAFGDVLRTGQCGVYRNITYSLQDQETPAQGITGTWTLVESFSNYSTTVSRLTVPSTQNISFGPTGIPADTQYFGKTYPACPGSNDHEEFDQSFNVTLSPSVTYALTTVNDITRGYYSGTATVDVTIITP
jgi:hypothetical protein